MKNNLATDLLIACVLFLGFLTGVGIFQHLFWLPEMFSSPLILTQKLTGEGKEPQIFWIPLHALTFITLIGSLLLNQKITTRKRLVYLAFGGYIYISLVSIVFAKVLFMLKDITDPALFAQKTHQWIILSWHRPILMAVIEVLLLIAISKGRPSDVENFESRKSPTILS